MADPQPLADLLPALLCGAVEDVTGQPCRRVGCDGTHSWSGVDPWAPAPAAPVRPDRRVRTRPATTPEDTR